MKILTSRFIFVCSAIIAAGISRFALPDNFAPMGAMALFAGAYIADRKFAFLVPMIVMAATDVFFGFHSTMPFVYGSYLITVLLGILISSRITPFGVLGMSLLSSILFFAITNAGVWLMYNPGSGYAGLMATYAAGVPFFRPTLISDLLFNTVLFGGFYLASLRFPKIARS
jgi:hypothetical protein